MFHRGNEADMAEPTEECPHKWKESNVVLDFSPEIHTRRCLLCGLVQHRYGLVSGQPHPSYPTEWKDAPDAW